MGIKFSKKEFEKKEVERTVLAEEFANRMISLKRETDKVKKIPNTESLI